MNIRLQFMKLSYYTLLFTALFFFQAETKAQDCPDSCTIFIPNTLTPNCDGIDCEFLQVVSNCSFSQFSFTFYDRFAEIRFESNDPKMKLDSKDYPEATYFWTLKAMYCNGKKIDYEGRIQIIK